LQDAKLVELARENANRLMEIMDYIDDGQLRCELNGRDVTQVHLAGFVRNLANLETIINMYEPGGLKLSAMDTGTSAGVLLRGSAACKALAILLGLIVALWIAMKVGFLGALIG